MKESDELELEITADEMCRTCLSQLPPDQLKPIFCSEIVDGRIISFPKILQTTMGFKPLKNESFPKNVCISCKAKLKELFSFKEKVSKSEDLLYEIFHIDKPEPELPAALIKPPTATAEIQTDPITVREIDESTYSHFLTIHKVKKSPTRDSSCQVKPAMKEGSVQTIAALKSVADASIQTAAPEVVQEDTTLANVLVTDLENEEHFLSLHVIQEDNEDDGESLEENVFESVISEEVDQHDFLVGMTSDAVRKSVKLEALDVDEHLVEYMNIETLDEPTTNTQTSSKPIHKNTRPRKNVPHHCNYCNYSTEDKAGFAGHVSVHQQSLESIFEKLDYFRCSNCNSVFESSNALQKHFGNGSCLMIDSNHLVQSKDVAKHDQFYSNGLDICLPRLKSFHKINKTTIVCGRCDARFKTLNEGVLHFVSIHETELDTQLEVEQIWDDSGYNQVHVCGICNDQFPDASFIRQHIYFHRNVYECPFTCTKKFDSFFMLTDHIKYKHLVGVSQPDVPSAKLIPKNVHQDYVCNICFKLFNSAASVKIHKRYHLADRRHVCDMCSKAFIQKSDLTIHIRSHTDERPFFCTVKGCDKRFRTSSHRRDHMSTHAIENKFQCEHCNKYFKAERILQGHMRLHTGWKPFECEICAKSFSRKQHLKLHMKTHDKE